MTHIIFENIEKYITLKNSGMTIILIPINDHISCNQIKTIDNIKLNKKVITKNNLVKISSRKGKRIIHGDLNKIIYRNSQQGSLDNENKSIFFKTKTQSIYVMKNHVEKTVYEKIIDDNEFPMLNTYDCEYDFIEHIYTSISGYVSVSVYEIQQKNKSIYISFKFNANKSSIPLILKELTNIIKLII